MPTTEIPDRLLEVARSIATEADRSRRDGDAFQAARLSKLAARVDKLAGQLKRDQAQAVADELAAHRRA